MAVSHPPEGIHQPPEPDSEPVEPFYSVLVSESDQGDHLRVEFPSASDGTIVWSSTDDSVAAISSTSPSGDLATLRYGRPGVCSVIAVSKSIDGKRQRAEFTVYLQADTDVEEGVIRHVAEHEDPGAIPGLAGETQAPDDGTRELGASVPGPLPTAGIQPPRRVPPFPLPPRS